MKTQCPHCQRIQGVPDHYQDKPIKCPKCRQRFSATLYSPLVENPHPQPRLLPVPHRRFLIKFAIMALAIGALIVLFRFVHHRAYQIGYSKGQETGYILARYYFLHVAPPNSAFSPPVSDYSPSPTIMPPSPGTTSEVTWTVLSRNPYFHTVSFKFSFSCNVSGSATPRCRFYDSDGFLLHEESASPYTCDVISGQEYQFSGHALVDPALVAHIATCIPSVNINSY